MKRQPQKKPSKYSDILNIIEIYRNNLFDYTPPENLSKNQVENALSGGIAALYKCDVESSINYGNWCCTVAYPADVIDNNGTFRECTTQGTDYAMELTVGKDCILLYNNSTKSPDDLMDKYARTIYDIDKTLESVVKYSRLLPIPKVVRDSDIAKYKGVMESVLEGNLINVISDNSSLLGTNTDSMLELTDSSASEKLHYLSEFRESVINRLCSLYGIPMRVSAKNAQVLQDEIHGVDLYSMYLLFDRYYARKESFERAKEFTGVDWNFQFGDIIKHTIYDVFEHADTSENELGNENIEAPIEAGDINEHTTDNTEESS